MQIDWFTFGAQIFNFVLLVYLLKRFLYRPVLDAIETRETKVRNRLEKARNVEEEAEEERERYQKLQEDLEQTRSEVLREAEEEAEGRRKELTDRIREEVETIRGEWHDSLRRQQESFLEELRRRMTRELYRVVEQVLQDLANVEVQDRLIDVFLDRLPEADDEEREEFLAAAVESGERVRLRSSFPLSAEQRRRLGSAIEEWMGSEMELQWEEDPELALGIELRAADRKMAWSVETYLDALQSETSELLEGETR